MTELDGSDQGIADDEWVDDGPASDDQYVAVRGETTRGRRVLLLLGALAIFVVLVLGVAGFWVRGQIDPGSPGADVTFVVPEGAATSRVASLLEEEGIVTNATVFQLYVRYKGAGPFQAGMYDDLRLNSAMGDVVDRLEAGPLPPTFLDVTIPEGLRLEEVRELLLAEVEGTEPAALDQALMQVRSRFLPTDDTGLEGFLLPETYELDEDEAGDEVLLVTRLVEQFDAVASELGYDEANPFGLSAYELVIIASLIEEEARIPEDQAKISRVIHNRLAEGTPLGIDAALLYEVGHTDTLTQSQLDTDSPYNTRLHAGLPPTPIAMPGRGALEAAMNPAEGDWLYYVLADENGGHFFTANYDEFLAQKEASQDAGLF